MDVSLIRVGNDNLFQSAIFSSTIAQSMDCRIEMLQTTGAVEAAIASGVGIGLWAEVREGLGALQVERCYEPGKPDSAYREAYERWVDNLKKEIELVKELDRFLKGSYFNNEQDYLFSVLPGGRKSYVINLVRAEKWNGYQDAQYYLDVSFTPLMSGSADR